MRTSRTVKAAVIAVVAASLTALAAPAAADLEGANERPKGRDRDVLAKYAKDTWRSFAAMTDPRTGLPADNIDGLLRSESRSDYTSPTNIGAYLWSTIVARDLDIIGREEARKRLRLTLRTVSRLEKHEASGMFYNWYSESTGEKLTVWPVDGGTVYPFLSSVDNGWLAAALKIVRTAEPRLRDEADAVLADMDFGFYYDPVVHQLRGGFWDEQPPDPPVPGSPTATVLDNYRDRGPDVWYTGHHYGTLNTEPRIASYLGIASGQIPPEHYFYLYRTFPNTCDWSWPEQEPVGEWTQYLGVDVFEGAYPYRGMQLVPTWGGSMFEALMVDLFVPEAQWGPRSWGVNHPLTVLAHIEHGLYEADYGYWGFSPASDPSVVNGYREYGVDAIGMNTDGYSSDEPRTLVDPGFPSCGRPAQPTPEFNDGVVTPHASFLALPYAPRRAMANLSGLRRNFDAYGRGGFYDTVNVGTGQVAQRYLSLDQGMIMAALGNELADDALKGYFVRGEVRQVIKPLLGIEEFNAAPRPASR